MTNPPSDTDQLRFASIRSRMIDGTTKNLPEIYLEHSGASNRDELREKLIKSDSIMAIIDCCAFEALRMEGEGRKHAKR
jgi:hypothetical protein